MVVRIRTKARWRSSVSFRTVLSRPTVSRRKNSEPPINPRKTPHIKHTMQNIRLTSISSSKDVGKPFFWMFSNMLTCKIKLQNQVHTRVSANPMRYRTTRENNDLQATPLWFRDAYICKSTRNPPA